MGVGLEAVGMGRWPTECKSSPHPCVRLRVHLPPTCQLPTGIPPPKVHEGSACLLRLLQSGPMVDSTRRTFLSPGLEAGARGRGL